MVGEFEFINNIKSRYSLERIGDDCAVLPKDGETDLLITTDLLIEDIDFRLEWVSPEHLGHKALAVSLSDIAAMGGDPKWATLSIGVPESLWRSSFMDDFYSGWHKIASMFEVELIGGDTSRSPDKLIIDCMVGGETPKSGAIYRTGARPGDAIFVTGPLGGAAGGLELLEKGARFDEKNPKNTDSLVLKQLKPWPRVAEGKLLRKTESVTSMIDLSDGLSSDLGHICDRSSVGAVIESQLAPIDPSLIHEFPSDADRFDLFLNGGEDFELLFTAPSEKRSIFESMGFHCIGMITESVGIIELRSDSETVILTPDGFRHF